MPIQDDIDNDNPRCDDDENEDCNDSNQNVSATSKRNTSGMNGNKGKWGRRGLNCSSTATTIVFQ